MSARVAAGQAVSQGPADVVVDSPLAAAVAASAVSAPAPALPVVAVVSKAVLGVVDALEQWVASWPGGPVSEWVAAGLWEISRRLAPAGFYGTGLSTSSGVLGAVLGSTPGCVASGNCAGQDLHQADLYGLNLSGVNFTGANLSGANLGHAALTGATLTNANVSNANLYRASLAGADGASLAGADLSGANASRAVLSGADLSRTATLAGAGLQQADLTGADLAGTNLTNANATNATLVGATLVGARLTGTILGGANLTVAQLVGADLSGKNLQATNFTRANLTDANLTEAFLVFGDGSQPAVLTGANLSGADLAGLGLQLDLSGATLAGANLAGAFLNGAVLRGADLRGVNLSVIANQDLSNTTLTGANLTGQNFTGITLTGATLTGANLTNTNLLGQNLAGQNLAGADLSGADLTSADLAGANLTGANLVGANLTGYAPGTGAALTNANLTGANLTNQNLDSTNLSGATLTGATLTGTTLSYANLTNATLANLDLSGFNLSGANLTNAILTNADLSGANLAGANLTDTVLSGATLEGANLTRAKLIGTVVDGVNWTNATCSDGSKAGSGGCTIYPAHTYLALEGGGLKALTAEAAVLAGTLQYLQQQQASTIDGTPITSLADLFSRVETLSANSGGSWLASFLAYSPQFVAQLESSTQAGGIWGPDGYMTAAQAAYNSYVGVDIQSQAEFVASIAGISGAAGAASSLGDPLGAFFGAVLGTGVAEALYQNVPGLRDAVALFGQADQSNVSWQDFMSQVIAAPLNLTDLQNIPFSDGSDRTTALKNVNLVFQSSLGTGGAVLSHEDGLGYQIEATNTGFSVNNGNEKYIPVLLSSMTNGSMAPPTMPTINGPLQGYFETPGTVNFNLPLTGNFNYDKADVTIQPFTFGGSVWTATNASSAALGMLGNWSAMNGTPLPGILGGLEAAVKLAAAPALGALAVVVAGVLAAPTLGLSFFLVPAVTAAILAEPWTPIQRSLIAWQFRDMAVPVTVDPATNVMNGYGSSKVNDYTTPETLAGNPILRLSDGYITDNTGIAANLTSMQANGDLRNGFEITYIANSKTSQLKALNGTLIDEDFVSLFGNNGTPTTPGSDYGLSTPHDSPNLFSTSQVSGLDPKWASSADGTAVSYSEIAVTTDAGNIYGLPAGVTGTINVIQIVNDDTAPVPVMAKQSGDQGFAAYQAMYNAIVQGMTTGGGGSYVGAAIADAITAKQTRQ